MLRDGRLMASSFVAAVVLGLAMAPVADAAPAWLAPVDLSAPGQNADLPQVALDLQGNATAVWDRYNGTNGIVQAATRPVSGVWQAPVDLSAPGQTATSPQVALDAQANATVVWRRYNGTNYIVQAAARAVNGVWQAPVNLSVPGQNASDPQVALDAQGNATAVWYRYNGTNYIVQAAARPAGGAWQAPVDLSTTGQDASSPQVALDAQGNATAVWTRYNGTNGIVQAAARPVNGVWQAPVDLSTPGQNAYDPQVALGAPPNATVVWRRSNGTNLIVQAATRPVSGVWQAPVDLSAAGQNAYIPQVALDAQGNATAIWQSFNGTNYIVQAAARAVNGAWQAPVDLSAPGQTAYVPQVALDAQGNATALWTRYDGTYNIVQAAGYDAAGPVLRSVSIPALGIAGRPVGFSVSPFDVWSALGATTWDFGDGASATGQGVSHTYTRAGSYHITLTSTDTLGNTTSTSGTTGILAGPRRPVLSRLSQAHRTWRETKPPKHHKRHIPPTGTSFRFTLDQKATLRLTFTHTTGGRKVKSRCVRITRKNHRAHRCTRTLTDGTITLKAHAGKNTLAFRGTLTHHKKLRPGHHTLTLTATNTTRQSSTRHVLRFTIVR